MKSTSSPENSRGASVCAEMTPITSPLRPRIGTERSDWNCSSSSSGTYLTRGSSSRFSRTKAGSRCSAAHQARPSPLGSSIRPGELRIRLRRRPEDEPRPVVLDEVDEARVHGARVGQEPDDRGEHLVQLERRGDRRDDAAEERFLASPDAHPWERKPSGAVRQRLPGQTQRSRARDRRGRLHPAREQDQCVATTAEVPLVGARLEDLADLLDDEADLVVRVVVVRPETDARVGTEVAEDLPLGQLLVHGGELRDVDDHRAATALGRPRAPDLEPRLVGELDEQLRLTERVGTDPVDADLLDQVVARRPGVVRRHVRGPGQEARSAARVAHLLLEAERRLVRLPAGVGRLEALGEVGPDVQPPVARAAAQPLHRAADREVDVERRHVERDDPGGLVAVEDHVRADLVGTPDDRLDVLDLGALEEHVADRHEQRPLVDRVDDRGVVLADDDVEVRMRLVEVAHRREVPPLVDDAVPTGVDRKEAREDDGLGDRDVLVHHRRPGRRPDDPADLVADRHRHRPPALAPRADAALAPHPRVLGESLLRLPRHRRQRVVDQVGRVLEDRELGAVVEQVAHAGHLRARSRLRPRRSSPALRGSSSPTPRPRRSSSRPASRRRR